MNVSREERVRLRNEIFHVSGMKVDEDDPLIFCALMQAKVMREAAGDVSERIAGALATSVETFEKSIDARSEDIAAKIAGRISTAVEKRTEQETARLTDRVSKIAAKLAGTRSLPSECDEPLQWRRRTIAVLAIAIFASALAAAKMFGRPSNAEQELLHFAHQVVRALPSMEPKAQKALFDAIRATSKKS